MEKGRKMLCLQKKERVQTSDNIFKKDNDHANES